MSDTPAKDSVTLSGKLVKFIALCALICTIAIVSNSFSGCKSTEGRKAKADKEETEERAETGQTGFSSGSSTSERRKTKTKVESVPLESITSESGITYRFGYAEGDRPTGVEAEITIEPNVLSPEYSVADLLSRKIGIEAKPGIWMMADGKPHELPARGAFKIPDGATKVRFFSSKAFNIKVPE